MEFWDDLILFSYRSGIGQHKTFGFITRMYMAEMKRIKRFVEPLQKMFGNKESKEGFIPEYEDPPWLVQKQ